MKSALKPKSRRKDFIRGSSYMRKKKIFEDYLLDMSANIRKALKFAGNVDFDEFKKDERLQYAII